MYNTQAAAVRAPRAAPHFATAVPVALLGISVLLLADRLRYGEALLVAWVLKNVMSQPAVVPAAEATFYFQSEPGDVPVWAAFPITARTSAVLFVGGVLLGTALLMVVSRRLDMTRPAFACLVTVVLLVAVNTTWVVLITEATVAWGATGYGWAHSAAGPILLIGTLCICALLFVSVALLRATSRP